MNIDFRLLTTLLSHLVTLGIVALAITHIVKEVLAHIERKKIEGTFKTHTNKAHPFSQLILVAPVYKGLKEKLVDKGKEDQAELFTGLILGLSIAPALLFGFFGQYLLMMVVPIAILKGAQDILNEINVTKQDRILAQLPKTIDSLVKTAGRHDNIQIALSEASFGLAQPMKGELEEMVRKMNSQDRKSVLDEFSHRYSNAWIRSFVFILSSLVEDAERKTALDNLRTLRDMVDQEQKMTSQSVGEKRSSVMQNYIIAGMALVSSIIVMFTDFGRQFYFETGMGLLSLVGGYIVLFITIKLNLNMMSKREGDS